MNDNPLCKLSDAEIASLFNAGEPLGNIASKAGVKLKTLRQRLVHLGFLKAKTFQIVDSRVTGDKLSLNLEITWVIRHDGEKYQVTLRWSCPLVDVRVRLNGAELHRLPYEAKDFDGFDPVKLLKEVLED